jgi:transposase
LSWRLCKKVSLPLLFVNLDKAGNSNTQERIDLLHMFHELFGFHRIRCLTADREFVGQDWFQMLILNKIPFTIRAKENTALPWGRHQKIKAQRLFAHLKTGEYRRVEKEMFGGTVYFAGTRNAEGELVIVITNVNVQAIKAFETYRKRWSIEELFRKLKTSGFHWENTHMTSPSRLDTLLIILCFGLTIGYLAGLKVKIPWKRTVNAALYSVFKQGLKELQFWLARGLEKTMALVAELFKNPCKSLFSKSDG